VGVFYFYFMKRIALFLLLSLCVALIGAFTFKRHPTGAVGYMMILGAPQIGEAIDSLHGVKVYYNGSVNHTAGRNLSKDGYNLGLKYQCVEFAKRYYYEYLHHKMPDSYGHAKDFFNLNLSDGKYNKARNLMQFTNGSNTLPQSNDLVIWKGNVWNPFGHIAVIALITSDQEVEIVQQNPGPHAPSRIRVALNMVDNKWTIADPQILGWLGKRK